MKNIWAFILGLAAVCLGTVALVGTAVTGGSVNTAVFGLATIVVGIACCVFYLSARTKEKPSAE